MKIFIAEILASLGVAFFMFDLLTSLTLLSLSFIWIKNHEQ